MYIATNTSLKDNDLVRLRLTKIVTLFLFITPFIDVLNGILGDKVLLGPGQIIRTSLLFYLIMTISISNKKLFIITLVFINSLLISQIPYVFLLQGNTNSVIANFIWDTRILFTFVLIISLINFFNDNAKFIAKVLRLLEFSLITISSVIIIGYILGVGYNTYTVGDNMGGVGFKGLFLGQNDLSAVISMGYPIIVSMFIYEKKHRLLRGLTIVLTILSAVILGTKAVLATIILSSLFLIISIVIKANISRLLTATFFLLVSVGVLLAFFEKYQMKFYDWLNYQSYFFYKSDSIITYLLGGRNNSLQPIMLSYKENPLFFITGTSFQGGQELLSKVMGSFTFVEFDPLAVLFYKGLITFFMFLFIFSIIGIKSVKLLNGNLLNKGLFLSFWAILINSTLGGHVIASGIAGTYLAMICLLVYHFGNQKN